MTEIITPPPPSTRTVLIEVWRRVGFAPVLFILLLAINIAINPARFAPAAWGTLIGLAAPLIGAALASYGDPSRADAMFAKAMARIDGASPETEQLYRAATILASPARRSRSTFRTPCISRRTAARRSS